VKGGYEHLKSAHEQVKEYCSSNGHTTKEVREVYLKGPRETQNPEEYQTEIQYFI
jgi:effector-binding domain-containing protein